VAPAALSPAVVNLISIVKQKLPRLELYLSPGATGRRAELGEKLGLARWREIPPAVTGNETILDVLEVVEPPPMPKSVETEMPKAQRPMAPARSVVRMAPKPRGEASAPQANVSAADNANLNAPSALPVEADIAARYDAEAGDHILSDDELRALLEDSPGSMNPNDPRHA
jgi:hypothetical protein